jgi:hypothetical protein
MRYGGGELNRSFFQPRECWKTHQLESPNLVLAILARYDER